MINLPRRAAAGVLLALVSAACSAESRPDEAPPARGTATGLIADASDSAAPASLRAAGDSAGTAAAAADTGWTAGIVDVRRDMRGVAVLQDVRVAAHQDFDRIVLDFGDAEAPGYHLEYVDRPVRACGSGEPVALPGDAWLVIETTPAAAHDDQGYATVQNRDMAVNLPIIERFRSICDFEAVVAWVAAVRSPNSFRVIELDSPTRLIVDIRH